MRNLFATTAVILTTTLMVFAPVRADVLQSAKNGSVNWSKGVVTATGYGVAPEDASLPKQKLLARRAAQLDAYRVLAELVQGVRVSSGTLVSQLTVASDEVKTSVEALIKGAVISEETYDGNVSTVVLTMPLDHKFLQAVKPALAMPSMTTPSAIIPAPKPQLVTADYTGVVIDASDVAVFEVAAVPQLRDSTGLLIYPDTTDSTYADNWQVVVYDEAMASALSSERVGQQPYVVKALGVYAGQTSDLIIDESAANMLQNNPSLQALLKSARFSIVVPQ